MSYRRNPYRQAGRFASILRGGMVAGMATLCLSFLFLYSTNNSPSVHSASIDAQSSLRLIPSGYDFPTLDPGNVDVVVSQQPKRETAQSSRPVEEPYPYPYPAPNPLTSKTLSPDQLTMLTAKLRSFLAQIQFSPGTTDGNSTVKLFELFGIRGGEKGKIVGMPFSIHVLNSDGEIVTRLNKAVKIVLKYEDDGMTKSDEKALALFRWSTSQHKWIAIKSTVDTENNTITALIGGQALSGQAETGQTIDIAIMGNNHIFLPTIQQ